jgi:hypothetical protein
VITRHPIYVRLRDDVPDEASAQLEREGWALRAGAFDADELGARRAEIEAVYANVAADVRNPERAEDQREDFRYEMLNRSAACQRVVADSRLLDVVEPLLGEDCHVIANTAWRNPPRQSQRVPGRSNGNGGLHGSPCSADDRALPAHAWKAREVRVECEDRGAVRQRDRGDPRIGRQIAPCASAPQKLRPEAWVLLGFLNDTNVRVL